MIASIARLMSKLQAQGFCVKLNSFVKDSVLNEYYQIGTVKLCKGTYDVAIIRDMSGIDVFLTNIATHSFHTIEEDRTSLSDVNKTVENILLLMN